MERERTAPGERALTAESPGGGGGRFPKRGNWLSRKLAHALLRLFGWKIAGEPPALDKFLLVGAPHTSNWDFVITMLVAIAVGLDLHWVAKHSVFAGPFGTLLRWMGGVSVNRDRTKGFVQQMVAEYERREKFVLAIMPEGTRSTVHEWRSGFFYIAEGAEVPLVPVVFDYAMKTLRIEAPLRVEGSYLEELPRIQSHFAGYRGKRPF